MERVELAPGLDLSRLIYGMWRLGDDADTAPARVQAKIEACLEAGITTLDQADIYGGYASETLLGAAFRAAPHLRDRVEIVTKCDIMLVDPARPDNRVKHYDTTAAHIRASLEASLAAMAVEQVDVLLLHRPDPLMDPEETGEALDALIAEGKTRFVGVSNFKPHDWDLLTGSMRAMPVTNQIEISLTAPEALINGDLAFLQARGVAPMAWSPLGGGALFDNAPLAAALEAEAAAQGVEPAAVALAWLLRHPATILPVIGSNRPNRIAAMARAVDVAMDRQTWFALYEAARGRDVA